MGLADEYVVASSQSIECRELQYWEYVVELLFRRYEEECLSLCVPNRNIESDEEYEAVADAFDEILDAQEFNELFAQDDDDQE